VKNENKNVNDKSNSRAKGHGARSGGLLRQIAGVFSRKAKGNSDRSTPSDGEAYKSSKREKRPLQRDLPPAEDFPIAALGEVLGNAARALQEASQAPMAICGNSVLAAAHLAAQSHADVVVDGRVSPTSEFFITVGGSGERKSAVDRYALKEIRAYEKRLQDAFNAAMFLQGRTASTKDRGTTTEPRGSDSDQEHPAPLPPLSPIIICEEPTFEGLTKNLSNGQPSQGIFSDEGGRFLNGYAMSSENNVATLAGLSKLWDGSPLDRMRAGDGSIKLHGRRLSFHLMVQPGVVDSLMGNPLAQEQGFLSRCLVAMPQSTVGTRLYRAIDLDASPAMIRYHDCLRQLLARAAPVEDPNDAFRRSQLSPKRLTLTDEAKLIYVEFHDSVEQDMAGAMKDLRAFANKAPEHLLRVAGTLAIIENVEITEISTRHVESARSLLTYFLKEACRLDERARQDPDLRTAQRLLDWLAEQDRPVSLVEIYQNGPTLLRNAKIARYIAGVLVEHGQITPVKGIIYRGTSRTEGWKLAA
jgi:hypothetical protein